MARSLSAIAKSQKIEPNERRRRTLEACFVGLVSVAYAASLTLARFGHQASADGYYHFAVARELARGRLHHDALALPWTIYRDLPVDHYFGFHLLLTPFAALPWADWGIALATIASFCLVPATSYWFMRARGLRFAWAWCFLPVIFANQDWRYLMLRGGGWLVALSWVFLHYACFVEGARARRWGIVLVSYVAMLSYQGALVLLPLHLGALLAPRLLCAARERRARLSDPLFTVLGLLLGLVVNPYLGAGATFRFLWFHVSYMNLDPAGLYPGLREFGPVPLEFLLANPDFVCAALVVLLAAAWVIVRAARGRRPSYTVAVLLGAALVGLVLTARAIRMREYAVPWASAFLGAATPLSFGSMPLVRRVATPAMAILVGLLLVLKWPDSYELLGNYLPAAQYRGARPVLAAHRGPPVLNVAEGDYTTLLWEDAGVATVQGLSHYFLYPNRPLFTDITAIRSGRSLERLRAVQRFYQRGVRLVAVQHRNSAFPVLERYPEAFELVFRSDPRLVEPQFRSSIYLIRERGLQAVLESARR